MKTRLVIPSRERGDWLNAHIHRSLNFAYKSSPIFMVRSDDSQMTAYEQYAKRHGIELTVYDGKGINFASQTYDYIIDLAIRDGIDRLIILDDDIILKWPQPILGVKPDFKYCEPEEVDVLFNHAYDLVCPQMPMLSFTPIMKRSQDRIITFCKPMMMVYTYYIKHFIDHPEHRFWQTNIVEARCDLNLSLRLLTEGYLTGYMNTLTLGDNVANPGGCAVYRDLDFEQRSVHELARLYPGLVTIYRRIGWGGDREQWRDAPKIRWKDAFDTAKFVQHFDEWPIDFANRIVGEYEKKYAAYIEEYRATH